MKTTRHKGKECLAYVNAKTTITSNVGLTFTRSKEIKM